LGLLVISIGQNAGTSDNIYNAQCTCIKCWDF
jgi:hypothetical protein